MNVVQLSKVFFFVQEAHYLSTPHLLFLGPLKTFTSACASVGAKIRVSVWERERERERGGYAV